MASILLRNLAAVGIPYFILAILVQQHGACLARVALLPVMYWATLHTFLSAGLSSGGEYDPTQGLMNQFFSYLMFGLSLRATVWAFRERVYVRDDRFGMRQGGVMKMIADSLDLLMNCRGVGWNWGWKQVRDGGPEQSRMRFVCLTTLRLVLAVFLIDCSTAAATSFSASGFTVGHSIFDPSLPFARRVLYAFVITALSGCSGFLGIDMTYQACALLGTTVCFQRPSQWPPLFDSPWRATSLGDFWGRRWHQILRQVFVRLGLRPISHVVGEPWGVIGAFLVSAVVHDLGMRAQGKNGDITFVYGFFMMNSVGIVLERLWERCMRKRVCGIQGWMWTMTWLVIWGTLLVDTWAQTGMLSAGTQEAQERRPSRMLAELYRYHLLE